MDLTLEQIESVAALKYESGFILLLDALQAEIDNLADELDGIDSLKEAQLLGRWRAFRQIYAILRSTPEEFALKIEEERRAKIADDGISIGMYPPQKRLTMPPDAVEALRKEYNQRIKKHK